MATTTPNIGLTLPTGTEKVSRQIINANNTLIDTAFGTLNSKLKYSNITPTNVLSGIENNLYIKKVSNVVIVSGYIKLPAGTYSDLTPFMKIPQFPIYNVFAFDNKNRIARVDGTGNFFYHESQTLSLTEYVFFNFSYAV